MSIRAIDNQISITRTSELAKDNSTQLRRFDLMNEVLTAQKKESDQHKQQSVAKTNDSEQAQLQADRDGDGHGYTPSQKERSAKQNADDILVVPGEAHIIDITI